MRWILIAFAAIIAFGQAPSPRPPAPNPELRVQGVVQDALTGQPIRDARVAVVEGRNFSNTGLAASTLVAQTSVTGTFEIKVNERGQSSIYATAEGYVQDRRSPVWFVVGNGSNTASVTVKLYRESALVGRIVDHDSQKPIEGIEVSVYTEQWNRGRRTPGLVLGVHSVVSDTVGWFRIAGLFPGAYLMELVPTKSKETVQVGIATPSEPNSKTLDYGRQWWPGGEVDNASTVQVPEGLELNLGDLPISRQELYRADLTIRPDLCSLGDSYRVDLGQEHGRAAFGFLDATVPCGGRVLFANLPSGKYGFNGSLSAASISKPQFIREWLNITDRNVSMEISPKLEIPIFGKVLHPDFPANSAPMRVVVDGVESMLGVTNSSGMISGEGGFELDLSYSNAVRVTVLGVPKGFYISEMLYNGVAIQDGILTPNESSPAQNLKITISDKAATVQGQVANDKGDPVPKSSVVAVPSPIHRVSGFPLYYSAAAGSDGKYTITGLAPGKYQVFAVPDGALDSELQKPGRIEIVAAGGADVDVSEGASQQIDLKLTPVFRN